jgi:hypothetical protein
LRRSWSWTGFRSDSGFTIVGAILAALTVMSVTAAVAAGIVVARHKSRVNPDHFSISISKVSAVRDTNDLPVITVSYRLNFESVAAVFARSTPVHVKCFGRDPGGRGVPGGDDSVQPQHVFEFGEQAITPGEPLRDLQGPVQVHCLLRLSGETLSFASSSVEVPGPTGSGGGTLTGVAGKYSLVFTRSSGSETDCVIDGQREIMVTALTATTVHVALTDTDGFDSALSTDLKYTGALALNPGFADYYGRMDGQFVSTANGIQVGGTMTTERPACTFSFQGSQH